MSDGMNLSDSVYQRLLKERIIFLGTDVNDEIANKLCAQILLLSAEDPTRDISLYINSPGGSVTAGRASTPWCRKSPDRRRVPQRCPFPLECTRERLDAAHDAPGAPDTPNVASTGDQG